MPSREYNEYMCSAVWDETRAMQLQRDRYQCRNCHSRQHLQVHHWYYWRDGVSILGKETSDDLVTLCEDCHLALTKIRRRVFGTGRVRRWFWWVVVLILLIVGLTVGLTVGLGY
jgi:hypothetical protein